MGSIEGAVHTLHAEIDDMLHQAKNSAMRGGRAALAKLETRIRELEIELGNAQSHTGENMGGHQKTERRCKELQFQIDEDKKNQIEEAEEIAALNLAKFRKAQQELEESEDRAN